MLLVEGALSIYLACSMVRREAGDRLLQFDSDSPDAEALILTNEEAKMSEVLIQDTLEGAIAKDFASVPQVRHVLTEWVDGPLLVWIAADDPQPDIRRRIYQKQLELINAFPEVAFDFNLVPSRNRRPEELASGARVVYSRPE
jgi:hypothetical protein